MMDFSQDLPPLSPTEEKVSLIILGILVVAVLLGVFLGPYLSAAWQELMTELKNVKLSFISLWNCRKGSNPQAEKRNGQPFHANQTLMSTSTKR